PIIFMFSLHPHVSPRHLHSFPTRRASDLTRFMLSSLTWSGRCASKSGLKPLKSTVRSSAGRVCSIRIMSSSPSRSALGSGPDSISEEHTSELQSRGHLVCRLLLEKKKKKK